MPPPTDDLAKYSAGERRPGYTGDKPLCGSYELANLVYVLRLTGSLGLVLDDLGITLVN